MTQSPPTQPNYTPAPPADFILSFDLANAGVRGRLVRLDAVSTRALSAHVLPEAATRTLGETLALSALLGSAVKLDGRLTIQTQSDGPLDLAAADYYGAEESDDGAEGGARPTGLRAYARLDEARFNLLADDAPSFEQQAGKGALAITIEPRRGGNTYQGIVALNAAGMAESAEDYFVQSEQLPTMIRLAAVPVLEPGKEPHWRAAGLLLQTVPGETRGDEDDWQRLGYILDTLEDFELIDTGLSAEDLLWRLFNEDEIRVHPSEPVEFRCDCRTDRIASVLRAYSPEEREGLADEDGIIRAQCEFCGKEHDVAPADLAAEA